MTKKIGKMTKFCKGIRKLSVMVFCGLLIIIVSIAVLDKTSITITYNPQRDVKKDGVWEKVKKGMTVAKGFVNVASIIR